VVLQDVASACSSVISVPPQFVEFPTEWLEPGSWYVFGAATTVSGAYPDSRAAANPRRRLQRPY